MAHIPTDTIEPDPDHPGRLRLTRDGNVILTGARPPEIADLIADEARARAYTAALTHARNVLDWPTERTPHP